jgi:hypothetical protein
VTFQEEEAKRWHAENTTSVKAAFGPTGEIQHRAYVVIAKRIRTDDLRKVDLTEAAREIGRANGVSVTKVQPKIPKAEGPRYASMIVETTSCHLLDHLCTDLWGSVGEILYLLLGFIAIIMVPLPFIFYKFGARLRVVQRFKL